MANPNLTMTKTSSYVKLASGKDINTPIKIRIAWGGWCYVWQVWSKDKTEKEKVCSWNTFAYVFAVKPEQVLKSVTSYLDLRGITN